MFETRRTVLKALAGAFAVLQWRHAAGALRTAPSAGATSTPEAFKRALAKALDGRPWSESEAISLDVPQLAENGAIVPITVESRLPGTARILVFAERNPGPLLAQFHFEPDADGWVSLRIKLNETGPVLAIAEAGGRFYGTRKDVKVMVGGCG
jgi:sulfur-oxidizing protein SoxY